MSQGDAFPYSVVAVGTPAWGGSVNNILNELITRSAAKVPFTAMQGGELPMGNVPITGAKYVGFTEQSVTPAASPVGRIEYYSGNFYLVTTSAAIQVTSGAGLNAAGIGGISGDYGGGNPASVQFVDASLRYDFYDNFGAGEWAYLRGRSIDIAAGATSVNYCRLAYGTAATVTITLPAMPTANRPMWIDNTGAITCGHGDISEKIPLIFETVSGVHARNSSVWIATNGTGTYNILVPGVLIGRRLKSYTAVVTNLSGVATQIILRKQTTAGVQSDIITASSAAGPGTLTWTGTAGAPTATVTGDAYFFVCTVQNTDTLKSLELAYDYQA